MSSTTESIPEGSRSFAATDPYHLGGDVVRAEGRKIDPTHQLEEWKARYESYRAYRNQYLTACSIVSTGFLVGISLAFGRDTEPTARLVILVAVLFGLVALLFAHLIARKAVRALGERIERLETSLGFGQFATTQPLESAFRVTMWITSLFLGFVLLLVVMVASKL